MPRMSSLPPGAFMPAAASPQWRREVPAGDVPGLLTVPDLEHRGSAEAFNATCRSALLQGERGELRALPVIDADFGTLARLAQRSVALDLPDAALLVNLQRARAARDAAPATAVWDGARAVPSLRSVTRNEARVIVSTAGTLELVRPPRDGTRGLVFCSVDGERQPDALRDMTLVVPSRSSALSLHDATLSRHPTELVVRDAQHRLALYRPDTDHVEPLPICAGLGGDVRAAISANGRYVAAHIIDPPHLVVFDRETSAIVNEATLPASPSQGLTVDSFGTVLLQDPQAHRLDASTREWVASNTMQHTPKLQAYGPNERFTIAAAQRFVEDVSDLVLADNTTLGEITLEGPKRAGQRVLPRSFTLAPGGSLAAVVYGNGTIRLFDLVEADNGSMREFRLPDDTTLSFAGACFSRDGSRLDIACSREPSAGAPDGTLEFLHFDLCGR